MTMDVHDKAVVIRDKNSTGKGLMPGDGSYDSAMGLDAFCFHSADRWHAIPGQAIKVGDKAVAFKDIGGDWRVFHSREGGKEPPDLCMNTEPFCSCLLCRTYGTDEHHSPHLERTYVVLLDGFPIDGIDGAYTVTWVSDCTWAGTTSANTDITLYAQPDHCSGIDEASNLTLWHVKLDPPAGCGWWVNTGYYRSNFVFPPTEGVYTMTQILACDDLGVPAARMVTVL